MAYTVKQKEDDIDDTLEKARDLVNEGESNFEGESYEAGVIAGIEWITGQTETNPLAD